MKNSAFGSSYSPNAAEDIRKAVAEVRASHKRILVVVGRNDCPWCARMHAFIAADPEIRGLAATFVTVRADLQANSALLQNYPPVPGTPHFFVLEDDGKLLYSQDTELLESGESYDRAKLLAFFRRWQAGTPPIRPGPDNPGDAADGRYVVVYGRDGCSLTAALRNELDNTGVNYSFKDVDVKEINEDLYARMRGARLDVSNFGLPVVDVNGNIAIRPGLQDVLSVYKAAAASVAFGRKSPAVRLFDISGIMQGNPAMAIIDGEAVKVGEMVGNYKVNKIGKYSVVFLDPQGKTVTQQLDTDYGEKATGAF